MVETRAGRYIWSIAIFVFAISVAAIVLYYFFFCDDYDDYVFVNLSDASWTSTNDIIDCSHDKASNVYFAFEPKRKGIWVSICCPLPNDATKIRLCKDLSTKGLGLIYAKEHNGIYRIDCNNIKKILMNCREDNTLLKESEIGFVVWAEPFSDKANDIVDVHPVVVCNSGESPTVCKIREWFRRKDYFDSDDLFSYNGIPAFIVKARW